VRPRRRVRQPPDLTSLFDVLFIVVFAALIRAAAVEQAAAQPPEPPRPRAPDTPPAVAALRQRALADLDAAMAARVPLVVRITREGTVEAIEVEGRRIALVVPLLERSADPSVVLGYGGDRTLDLQVCRIVARQLGTADLSRYLVIVAPPLAPDDLLENLQGGLKRDVQRCMTQQHAFAALIDPTALAGALTGQPSQPQPSQLQPSGTSPQATP
jgi:hypothetical protein